jgi:NADH dehydrogenase
VRLGAALSSATANAAFLREGERIPTRTIVVTTGVAAHPVLTACGLSMSHGRLVCDEFGRVLGKAGLYAAGDDAAIPDASTGQAFPTTLGAAHALGRTVAKNIIAELEGTRLRHGRPRNFHVATLGQTYGLAQIGRAHVDGFLAALLWRIVFLGAIPSWYRRTTLLLDWLVTSAFPRDVTQLQIARTNAVVPMRFGAGEAIIHQGEAGSRFYVITKGQAEVLRRAADGIEQRVVTLGPGRYFGEVALLRGEHRNATVRALTDLSVVSLDQKDFATLVRVMPHVLDAVGDPRA